MCIRDRADGVHFGVDQRGDAVHHVAGDANGGGAEQAALAVLGGVGVLLGLCLLYTSRCV